MKLHLHQFLSRTGLFKAKRDILLAVEKGEVKVGGLACKNHMFRFNPNNKEVMLKGKVVKMQDDKLYFLVNKPVGYISGELTVQQEFNKKSIYSLLKLEESKKNTLFCVGRLDENSSGLIIVTNDGKLSFKITNPNNMIVKKYYVELLNELRDKDVERGNKGLEITVEGDGKTEKVKVLPVIKKIGEKKALISITEGRKHEVKKIFHALGNKVLVLERIAIAGLKLGELKPGEYIEVKGDYIKERL